ncbi:MAG: DUF5005 domain-containing protein [Bacteroidota bacterium]|nr:DUF5005 domain-containing protein [Bacteroidota bacterium]
MKTSLLLFGFSLSLTLSPQMISDVMGEEVNNCFKEEVAKIKDSLAMETSRLELIPNTGKWDSKVEVYSDLAYNDLLTRYSGWNGGDGCYTLLLPDGRILWSFQDSFFGQVKPDRARVDNAFVHNAGILQPDPKKTEFIQLNPGKEAKSKSWIEYPDNPAGDKDWYWSAAGLVHDGKYYKLLGHIQKTGPGAWDFKNMSTDLAIFSLPDFRLIQIVKDKTVGDVCYGSGIFDAPDGYTYLYGTTNANLTVARAANHDISGKWEFYTRNGWADQPDNYSIGQNISPQPNVFQDGCKFYLVSQQVMGQDIYLYEAASPVGPWLNKRTIYRIPDKYDGSKIITYNACLHPVLSKGGELVISYNVNPVDFWDNFNAPGSADMYRPYFIRVFNWK